MIIKFISPNKKLFLSDKITYRPDIYNFKVLTSIFRFYRNRNFKIVKEN